MVENKGCRNPNECMLHAKHLLDTLPRKWDPCYMLPEDYEEAPTPGNEGFEFDRRVMIHGPITNSFRIFTEGNVRNYMPDLRITSQGSEVRAATAGFCYEDGNDKIKAGVGIFADGENGLKRTIRVPAVMQQLNQASEALAVKILADSVSARATLHNKTNSKHVLKHLITSLKTMEDNGYIGVPNKNILQAMVASY